MFKIVVDFLLKYNYCQPSTDFSYTIYLVGVILADNKIIQDIDNRVDYNSFLNDDDDRQPEGIEIINISGVGYII